MNILCKVFYRVFGSLYQFYLCTGKYHHNEIKTRFIYIFYMLVPFIITVPLLHGQLNKVPAPHNKYIATELNIGHLDLRL